MAKWVIKLILVILPNTDQLLKSVPVALEGVTESKIRLLWYLWAVNVYRKQLGVDIALLQNNPVPAIFKLEHIEILKLDELVT